MKENRCIHCGAIIPGGRFSCYICEKSKPSRHDKVMIELKDIARALNIDIDYIEDDGTEFLICDGQRIATTFLSIECIRQEFFGYVFIKEWKYQCSHEFYKKFIDYIKLYWE